MHSPWTWAIHWWVGAGRKGGKGEKMGNICNTIKNKKYIQKRDRKHFYFILSFCILFNFKN